VLFFIGLSCRVVGGGWGMKQFVGALAPNVLIESDYFTSK
jgi:hypothetical protein